MVFRGRHGDDDLNGTSGNDVFNIASGGNDSVHGGQGDDIVWTGAALTAADKIDGGDGNDQVNLNGDYSAGLTFAADTITNVEKLYLAAGFSYKLTTDGNIAAGERLTINARNADLLTFDGSHESDGHIYVHASAGDDVITTGAKADHIFLERGGNDTIHAGAGGDTIYVFDTLTADDRIDGGSGDDVVVMQGQGDDITFSATTMTNVETLVLKSSSGIGYALVTDDATVASGATLTVDGSALGATNMFAFNGGAETDGAFHFIGGGSNLIELTGGAKDDVFDLTQVQAFASTTASGGGGADTFQFAGNFDSSSQVIDGGAGNDVLSLDGDYTSISLVGGVISDIQRINFAGGHSYTGIQLFDNISDTSTRVMLDASALTAGDAFEIDGTNATKGYVFIAGAGAVSAVGSSDHDDFYMGAHFGADDTVDGGASTDTIVLNGDYSSQLSITSAMMTSVEDLVVLDGHDYSIKFADDSVAGAFMVIDGGQLGVFGTAHVLTFDGSAETTTAFTVYTGSGDDDITTGGGADQLNLGGGNDTMHAGGGDDAVLAEGWLTAADTIDGGAGSGDQLVLDGDYSAGLTFAATTIANIEEITLEGFNSYKLTMNDGNVAAGQTLTVNASELVAADKLTFDGSAETDGKFSITGGAGDDVLTGGAQGDTFSLQKGGTDTVHGGDGDDTVNAFATLTAADKLDGGTGTNHLALNGDYTGANALVLGAATLANFQQIAFMFGHSYDVATNDATVAAGQTLSVLAQTGGGDSVTFDGSAETDGHFSMQGGLGADDLTGGALSDTFDMTGGGIDTVHGGGGDDTIKLGATLTAADTIDGGTGTDTLNLTGDYSAGLTFGATTIAGVETLSLGNLFSYKLTTDDANVGSGATLSVDASALGAGHVLTFDGSAESDGKFSITDGAGDDALTGGAGVDVFNLVHGGDDTAHGGAGNDTFNFTAAGSFTAADSIDGGANTDIVNIAGGGSFVFTAATIADVEQIGLTLGSYDITTVDANVAAGATLSVSAAFLDAASSLTFDGRAETDGAFSLTGGAGNDVLYGGAKNDSFNLTQGGNDTATGGAGNDTFSFGGAFTAADTVDGGANTDTISLNGDYSAGLTFGATTMTSIENIVISAPGHSYDLTTVDANVAAGANLSIVATNLGASDTLTFDGSAETDGRFTILGGAGDDTITSGAQIDTITGGGGADTFIYASAAMSSSTWHDVITDFAAGTDKLDLGATVTGIFAVSGAVDAASFDGDLAGLGVIQFQGATVVTVTGGDLAGHTLLVVDGNGDDVYTAGQDYVLDITNYSGTITVSDFV